jgi:uncharacterized damage-inducible protein DinB
MPSSVDLLRRLREHQLWVRDKLLAAARNLTPQQLCERFPIGQGTYLATLTHLYAAELVWINAITGADHTGSPFGVSFDSIDALSSAWKTLDQSWMAFYGALDEASLSELVRKVPSSGGPITATPLADVLMHLALHSSHTAAQAINMLRQLGVSPLPDPMLISLSRSQHAEKG